MEMKKSGELTEAFVARISADNGYRTYVLRLYVAASTARSQHAIQNNKRVCKDHLVGRYDLEVIDIYQQPQLAESVQVIAVPKLIKKLPDPLRKFVGDLSDEDRILVGLDLIPKKQQEVHVS
jgi:circadian clock protein KaiB